MAGNQIVGVRNVFRGFQLEPPRWQIHWTSGDLQCLRAAPRDAGQADCPCRSAWASFRAKAGGVVGRFGLFIDHRKRQAEVGGDLFGRLVRENLAQQFVGLHDQTMKKPWPIGKREAVGVQASACLEMSDAYIGLAR